MMYTLNNAQHMDQWITGLVLDSLHSFDDFTLTNEGKDHLIWLDYLLNPRVQSILNTTLEQHKNVSSEDKELSLTFDTNLNGLEEEQIRVLLLCAICSLQLYVLDNFLCFLDPSELKSYSSCLHFFQTFFSSVPETIFQLNVGGEKLCPVARNTLLLRLSRLVLKALLTFQSTHELDKKQQLLFLMSSLRCSVVHQSSLQSTTSVIYNEVLTFVQKLKEYLEPDSLHELQLNAQLRLSIHNEVINSLLLFNDIEHSKQHLAIAKNICPVQFSMTGCLGTRTLYQSQPVPQLMIRIERDACCYNNENERKEICKVTLPHNEKLEDDTLLSTVKFVASESINEDVDVQLTEVEQCYLMTTIKYTTRFGSSCDNLLHEQLLSYIYFMLEKSNFWSITFNLLELRSLLEQSSRRRVERSMKQLETLVETVRYSNNKVSASFFTDTCHRLQHFYSILPNPFWIVEKHLADLLASLGVVKSALDIYLRLELWTEVIACYRQVGRPDKAEEIVREQLQKNGDNQPNLHCLLGELTGQLECYHYSWKISGERYARAPKMLGMHYFSQKEYDMALEYFKRSVEVNSMQTDVWYRIGYIGLQQENWELAVDAYRRVLQFDPDSFEAWNNLSKAYIKLGDKLRAMNTLEEAIKCNFDEWKLWENYIAVTADVGAFNELIEAWNRLIELKGHYIDDQIAEILVCAIVENVKDCSGESAQKYLPKVRKLFGRVSATSDGSATFWRQYAKLLLYCRESETSRITQCLQKCHRKMLSITAWQKDPKLMDDMLKHAMELVNEYQACAELNPADQTILNSCRLILNSLLTQVRKAIPDLALVPVNQTHLPELEKRQAALEEQLSRIKVQLGQCS